jgi:hypothetical protein
MDIVLRRYTSNPRSSHQSLKSNGTGENCNRPRYRKARRGHPPGSRAGVIME